MKDEEKERWMIVGLILLAVGKAICSHFGERNTPQD